VSDVPEPLRVALADRYDLSRVLGRGGMATVYLAADRKHHRQVAIKVLRADLAATLGADRFLQEIQIAARLTHPHILALHDSGESGGFLYYVMPFIDGGSLRGRIEAVTRLDSAAALAIAGPVAGALGYAHRMGVLHRDIKPENILFAQGLPVVADFGIAKAVSTAGGEQLTRTGFPLGTPGYMSPEQAAGLTDLDIRTDVYALAVVCYEMLVGSTPGRWPTEDAVRAGKFLDAPPAHRVILDTLPSAIEPALVRAMAIRHDQRTDAPEELLAQLWGKPGARTHGRTDAQTKPETEDRGTGAPKRRFSDVEVQEIMRRAADLDATQPTMSGALTIGSIQKAAEEAGIDPALVRAAASQLAPAGAALSAATPMADPRAKPRPFSGAWFAGGPTRIAFERTIVGELSEADCAYLIEEVRNELANAGLVSMLAKSVSWVSQRNISSGVGRDVQATITMRGGSTRITVREALSPLAGVVFGGIGGGVGGGGLGPIMGIIAGGLHAPGAAGVAAVLWVAAVLSGARSVFHYSAKRRTDQLERLINRLAELGRAAIAESALPSATPQGRLKPGP
jgi:serine/threonine protein kinase